MFCKKCGTEVSDGVKFCPSCGSPIGDNTNPIISTSKLPKKSNKLISWFVVVAMVLVGVFYVSSQSLTTDEKLAVRLINNIVYKFKDPSSVQVTRVSIGVDKNCIWAVISAINGFGARNSTCYYISDSGYITESDDCYTFENEVNVDKINKNIDN